MHRLFPLAKKLISNNLLKGSLIMFVGSLGVGFLNYLFYPVLARFITKGDYASLIAVTSIVNFIAVPTLSLNTVVVRFTSEYRGNKEEGKIKSLFIRVSQIVFFASLVVAFVLIVLSRPILEFLHISNATVPYLLALLLVVNLVINIPYGILQGLLKFHYYVLGNSIAAIGRLVFAVLLVVAGFGLTGSLTGMFLGLVVAYVFTLFPLFSIFKKNASKAQVSLKEILFYSFPTTLTILGITAFVTSDILLVNHFFPKDIAGEYALGSVLGRVITFSALPITNVMFPLVSEKFSGGKPYSQIFLYAFGAIVGICAAITLGFSLLPHFIISLIGKGTYELVPDLLYLFGIFASLQAIATCLSYFNLAVKNMWASGLVVISAAIQYGALWLWHGSLDEVLLVNILVCLGLVAVLGTSVLFKGKPHTT